MKMISLKLPDMLHTRLNLLSRRRNLNKSDIVREALEKYLNGDAQATPGSFLELTHDLLGACAGPPDLSSNKKHFEGYGR